MGALVKIHNGDLIVATDSVHTKTYSLLTADYALGGVPPDGWVYYADVAGVEDFAAPWKQPGTAEDAYDMGAIVSHNNLRWRSTILGNVWEPGITGWADASTDIPSWLQPLGAHDAYSVDAVVQHTGKTWLSLLAANVWEPGVTGWRETARVAPDGSVVPPAWVQPLGAQDAYPLGAVVSHNGFTWTSDLAANVWEPGVFGWTQN
jgi:hypothetical protein